jgi:hypothetical protein
MRLPGFTANVSIYRRNYEHRMVRPIGTMRDDTGVSPQLLFGIGFCMADCDRDDWDCLFDCLSPF